MCYNYYYTSLGCPLSNLRIVGSTMPTRILVIFIFILSNLHSSMFKNKFIKQGNDSLNKLFENAINNYTNLQIVHDFHYASDCVDNNTTLF